MSRQADPGTEVSAATPRGASIGRGEREIPLPPRMLPIVLFTREVKAATSGVVGREQELAALGEFAAAIESPSALVLAGEAGIGKTTLWNEGVAAGRKRSYRVLSCRPTGAETQLSFAALADLLSDVIGEVLPDLPAPQRRALRVALLLEDVAGRAPDRRTIAAAFLGTLRVLAHRGPVLVAIDDAQWLDPPSESVLEFAVRRLRDEPIGLLLAVRLGGAEETALALERVWPEERLRRIRLEPLSLGALHHLLRMRLGVSFQRPTLRRVWEASGGNPFYALELGRALERRGGHLELGQAVPVPGTLQELVRERLAGLAAPVQDLLRVIAALSDPTIPLVVAAWTGEDPKARALDAAVEAGVIEVDGERLRFAHPLLASGVYSALGPQARRALHRRLAEVVEDAEERARHLALAATGPDPEVASALDDAARTAYRRGATDAAAELSEQARRLTPKERAKDLRRRRIEAAEYHFEAGDTARARSLLEQVVADSPPGPARADALFRLGTVRGETETLPMGVELYREALGEAGDSPSLRAAIHQKLAWEASVSGDIPGAEPHGRIAVELAEQVADPSLLAPALAALAHVEFLLGRGIAAGTFERALALEKSVEYLFIDDCPSTVLGFCLLAADELDGARAKLEALHQSAIERGDEFGVNIPLFYLSWLECRAGNWELAARYADAGYQSVLQTGREPGGAPLLYAQALVDAHLGRVKEARAGAEEGLAVAERTEHAHFVVHNLSVLGFLELSLGNPAEAHAYLERAAKLVASMGCAEPGVFPVLPDEIEALVALGELKRANELVQLLEQQARAVDRASALAAAARCRGLLAAASAEHEAALAAFQHALKEHSRVERPFELARTLLAFGTTQRRAKQKRGARESLERAHAMFEELGAPLWTEKARAEIARIGGRARASRELTPTEQRVATFVAQGLSNKEVAASLFVTPRTVEGHLSKIYSKLGVRSRAELAHRFAAKDQAQAGS